MFSSKFENESQVKSYQLNASPMLGLSSRGAQWLLGPIQMFSGTSSVRLANPKSKVYGLTEPGLVEYLYKQQLLVFFNGRVIFCVIEPTLHVVTGALLRQ